MNRREFVMSLAAAPMVAAAGGSPEAQGRQPSRSGRGHGLAGKTLPPWRPGEFQVHFIYTGVAESMFWIMPDGTTMLLDCGDHPAITRGKKAVWTLPNGRRHAGEWIARYVARVNPAKTDVDYLMISHHHADHSGQDGWGSGTMEWNGQTLSLSGVLEAAKTLRFKRGFDRGWPGFDEPVPNERCDRVAYPHIRKTLAYLIERDGLEMRKFDVGAVNQLSMLKAPDAYPSFEIVNIAGNGKILQRNGNVRDLYGDFRNAKSVNENAMSLGLLVRYGPFRFYSAGDLSCRQKLRDGSVMDVEAEIAKEIDPVDVAKVNHHGHHSMPDELVAALRARVWTACMWDQLHMTSDTLGRLASRSSYEGPRLIAPCVFPPERRFEDAGKPFMEDIAPESFEAGHVVLTVSPGGNGYSIAYVTADDESMRVTGAYDFASAPVPPADAFHVRAKISDSARYEGLHPRFAKAFAFLRRADLGDLPCGKYDIDGENCWATVSEASLKPFADENQYEVHRAYIDIQAPLTGRETIGVASPDKSVFKDFNEKGDYVLFRAKGEPWTLEPGEFAVFFPEGGAHAPGLSSDGPRTIRKVVVKVRSR